MKLRIVGQFDPATQSHHEAEYAAIWNGEEVLKDYDYYHLKHMVRPENIRSYIFWHPLYSEIMGVAVTSGLEIGGEYYPAEEFKNASR